MSEAPRRLTRWIDRVAIAVMVVSAVLLARSVPMEAWQQALQQWMDRLGVWGPVLFAAIYVVATVLLIPGSVMTLIAGSLFGILAGFVTVSVASTLGAALAFLIARHAARRKVERFANRRPKFAAIDKAISDEGWKVVALLRLSPLIPFNLQNYLFGLTDVRFGPYVLSSWLAMMPGTLLYVSLGNAAGAAAGLDSRRHRSPAEWALLAVGIVATLFVTVLLSRKARQKLERETAVADRSQSASGQSNSRHWPKTVALCVGAAILLGLASWSMTL